MKRYPCLLGFLWPRVDAGHDRSVLQWAHHTSGNTGCSQKVKFVIAPKIGVLSNFSHDGDVPVVREVVCHHTSPSLDCLPPLYICGLYSSRLDVTPNGRYHLVCSSDESALQNSNVHIPHVLQAQCGRSSTSTILLSAGPSAHLQTIMIGKS